MASQSRDWTQIDAPIFAVGITTTTTRCTTLQWEALQKMDVYRYVKFKSGVFVAVELDTNSTNAGQNVHHHQFTRNIILPPIHKTQGTFYQCV